jgi:hypothetical protein
MDLQIGALSEREKQLRDKFVREYQIQMDYELAAIAVGFPRHIAYEMGRKFSFDPYVEAKIQELKQAGTFETVEVNAERDRRIVGGLFRESNYFGPDASHSARVTGLSQLAKIRGLEAAAKTESKITHEGKIEHSVAIDLSKLSPEQLKHYRACLESQVEDGA